MKTMALDRVDARTKKARRTKQLKSMRKRGTINASLGGVLIWLKIQPGAQSAASLDIGSRFFAVRCAEDGTKVSGDKPMRWKVIGISREKGQTRATFQVAPSW